MFNKHISEISFEDVYQLVQERKTSPNRYLEYQMPGMDMVSYLENIESFELYLAQQTSAFANSQGGWLIIGVDAQQQNIPGIAPQLNKLPIEDWIAQTLLLSVDFKLPYDIASIVIPDSENEHVVVVMHIPESPTKPHMVVADNKYFLRKDTLVRAASHQEVKDLFLNTQHQIDALDRFLYKRNLLDEESPKFGFNINSYNLYNTIDRAKKPFVLFSLIPHSPHKDKIPMGVKDFKEWLKRNSRNYQPSERAKLFSTYDIDTSLNGVTLKNIKNRNELTSYFEILNNGYVESGMSQHLAYEERAKHRDETIGIINLTNIVGYQMMLLDFARSFYELLHYDEEITLQLSFVNVLHYTLYGFHSKYFNSRLYYFYDEYQNKYDPNFKLVEKFHPLQLTDEEILKITMRNSEKICRAFGLEQDMAFFENQIDLTNFSYFDL
ncbi:MAG TPA: hypothetical protein DCS93_04080 [Microscillaceae bacterium]|nr:hypothetical protein [Microscillaceae bacterium]